MNRIKPGQGLNTVDRLNALAAAHNGSGYEFWIEWQPKPAAEYDLQAGYYLHVLYEYIKVDRSLTELSSRWRNFKYGVWLGSTYDSSVRNLSAAVQTNRLIFSRRFHEVQTVTSNSSSEIIER